MWPHDQGIKAAISVISTVLGLPPLAHSVIVRIYFIESLPTLSNQDRELHEEVVLSARGTGRDLDPPVLVPLDWWDRKIYQF